ncbi:phosphodiester glycosidase family protein [Brachybacterium sp. FME24]|uniref:phosphodiester glycosidase family protein n=1 Tax=Brachybacterium sp. FME24 TaxID=2742605 RepID=UPI001868B89F|nr:phosphodiester glycosidase family protein [Brachybacterium sp. FME24]
MAVPASPAAPTAQTASIHPSSPARLLALLAALALLTPSVLALQSLQAPPAAAEVTDAQLAEGGVLRDSRSYRVAPGLDLTNFSRLESGGWNEGSVLTADLRESSLSMDVAHGGQVTGRAPLQDVMASGPSGDKAVAAVNGTFFDINHSDAPIYTSVSQDGVQMGSPTPRPAFTVADGQAAVQALSATGTLTVEGDTAHELAGVNNPSISEGGIGLYTAAWGDYTLDRPVGAPESPATTVARATVVDGVVTEVSGLQDIAGDPEIADGEQVLLGREGGAEAVAALEVGQEVQIEVGPSEDVDLGIAGSHQILADGEVPEMGEDSLVTGEHPRTAVGVSKDGSQLFVMVIDGRTTASRGMTLPEAGKILRDMGAHNALNLDGGGSSALAARTAGAESSAIWNSPSDGEVREVPNALVFYSDAPTQELGDVQITRSLEEEDSAAVFPGMQRTLKGTGLGANLEPVMADGSFTADGPLEIVASDTEGAIVQGTERGTGTLTYAAGGHEAGTQLRVLGDPVGLQASERSLNLPSTEDSAELTLSGYDADGQRTRIEAGDVEVSVEGGFTVSDDGLGTWSLTATGDSETGSVTFTAGDLSTTVALTHGIEVQQVFDLSDPTAFSTDAARATGAISAAEGPPGVDGAPSPAIGMAYDFASATATRGFYLVANDPVTVDGTALAFSMDVRGDASGVWPRLQVTDAHGTVTNLDGDHITEEGWRTVQFNVPEGLAQPLTVERVRMMETRPEAQYEGDIAIANLEAMTTPEAETPAQAPVRDAALLAQGSVEERPQQIAVMSDAQFIAADPTSGAVDGARRTLREIKDAEPDLLVINGDFVDEASSEDFELAQRILDEEWGTDIPYVYVPGNHEIMGGDISTFEAAFGPVTTQRNLGRTKVVTLNTSTGSLAGGGIDQIAELESTLAEVAQSDNLTGITVFFHHPPTDPLASKTSQLGDQREARALEETLAEFRRSSGKSAALINGHVGVFHGAAVEGVTTLINGNSGKDPAGTPETGGFTGWTMLGVNPGAGTVGENPSPQDRVDWLAAETHPWVDEISLSAAQQLSVGGVADVSATFTQDDRTIPVAWPVTAQWGGQGVQVDGGSPSAPADGAQIRAVSAGDAPEQADSSAVVRVNPMTGEITGLRPGTATVQVTVNGRTAQSTVVVAGDEPGPTPQEPEPEEPGDGDEEAPGEGGTPGDDQAPGDGESPDAGGNLGEDDGSGGAGDPGDSTSTAPEPDEGDGTAPGLPAGASDNASDDAGAKTDGGDGSHAPVSAESAGPLARTGAEAWPVLLGALALMALGGGALYLARRRR